MTEPQAVITGGTAGIGFEIARGLLRHGHAIHITGRNRERGSAARQRLLDEFPSASVTLHCHDLAEPDQLAALADAVERDLSATGIQVLVHNAGLMNARRETNSLGWELMLAANHLAPFELSRRWLPLLRPQTTAGDPPRMLVIASDAHRWVRTIDLEDLQLTRNYRPIKAYARSKLANVLFARELARRLPDDRPLALSAIHPGGVATTIGFHAPWWMALFWRLFHWRLLKPEQAAEPIIEVAVAKRWLTLRGDYLNQGTPQAASRAGRDEGLARRLWQRSEEIVGRSFQP